jgi:hypothetical protein
MHAPAEERPGRRETSVATHGQAAARLPAREEGRQSVSFHWPRRAFEEATDPEPLQPLRQSRRRAECGAPAFYRLAVEVSAGQVEILLIELA